MSAGAEAGVGASAESKVGNTGLTSTTEGHAGAKTYAEAGVSGQIGVDGASGEAGAIAGASV